MILIDDRTGSKELFPLIRNLGVTCEITRLEYGDAAFEGHGPHGIIMVGVERKTLHDMLCCIEDSRYAAHQLPGMQMMYARSFLALEGLWRPGDGQYAGALIEGFRRGQSWGPLKVKGSRQVLYSKLYRYMVSVQMAGVMITESCDILHTAYNICELYYWFQKPWNQHTALRGIQRLAIPTMTKPTLVRRWAHEINDIGVKYSEEAERIFGSPKALANSDELDWLQIPGVGIKTARQVIKDINGWK